MINTIKQYMKKLISKYSGGAFAKNIKQSKTTKAKKLAKK